MPCHLLSTGRFWMSWTDFCEIFDEVEVCPMDECAKKARLDSRKFSLLKEEIRCLSTVNRQTVKRRAISAGVAFATQAPTLSKCQEAKWQLLLGSMEVSVSFPKVAMILIHSGKLT